jgi:hypothetical protein
MTVTVRPPAWVFWLYLATWLPYLCCTVLYGLRSPWRSSRVGMAMFALYASITAVLTVALVIRLLDLSMLAREVWLLVTLGVVALVGFAQLALILRHQRQDRAPRKEESP